jgi:hypothetical protein
MPAALAKLRDLAPYAVLALVLPGGSVVAFLLWLHRRRKGTPALAGGSLIRPGVVSSDLGRDAARAQVISRVPAHP